MRREQAHRDEINRRWAAFTPETRSFLDWLTGRYGEDLAVGMEHTINRELGRCSAESSAQIEPQLAVLREKQLSRVEKLKARIHQLEQELADASQGLDQVQERFREYVQTTNERLSELTGELAKRRQEQERAAGQEDQHTIEAYREKLAQASARINKLEGQVEIQRQRLGQYYQRFYPSSLAVAAQKLMALGAAMNYRILLKYDSQAVGVGSGEQAWHEFATHANYEDVAQAIVQAQFLFDNLYALGMLGNRDSQVNNDSQQDPHARALDRRVKPS